MAAFPAQVVTTDFLLKSLKENTDFILKSFSAHMGAISKRVDENAGAIASNSSAIAGNKARIDGHDDMLANLSERMRSLEQKSQTGDNQVGVRASLSQDYLLARRSIRLWPVVGETESAIWEGVGDFIHDTLRVRTDEVGQNDIEAVSRVIEDLPRNSLCRHEVLVTFISSTVRDNVVSHSANLAPCVDDGGKPTAGIRLEIPRELNDTFRLLSRFGTRLRARHGAGTKRHIKFDDFTGSLYSNVKLPGDETWTRVSPATAREDLLASVKEENVCTRKRLATKLVPGPRERLNQPVQGPAGDPVAAGLATGRPRIQASLGPPGKRPRWTDPESRRRV